MKGLLTIPLVCAVLLSGCSKPAASTDSQSPDSNSSQSAPAPAPSSSSAPKPVAVTSSTAPDKTPAKSTAAPAAPVKILAPEGTLFASQRITITNDDGVFSVAGGARLKIVRKTPDGFIVNDGKRDFPVTSEQVTNEVVAASTAAQIHKVQSTADTAAAQAQASAQAEMQRNQQAQAQAALASDEKDRQLRLSQGKSLALANEIADLTTKINTAAAEAQRSWEATHYYGRISTRSIDTSAVAGYQRRLATAQEEKRQVDQQILQLQFSR